MSFQTPITIAQAIESVQRNEYVLPAIQREFIWKAGQITKLFDSLMRGYPIGSFLFWRIAADRVNDYQYYSFLSSYHQDTQRHNLPIKLSGNNDVTAILDGQQRLTAINIGLKGTYAYKMPYMWRTSRDAFPKRRLYLNLLAPPKEEGDLAFEFKMLRDTEAQTTADAHWFLVGDILKFRDVHDAYNYCMEHDLIGKDFKHPSNTLVQLWQVIMRDGVVNYFLETSADLDKVLNIFIRVNSGGTPLSSSDMLLSIATAQWESGNARDKVHSLVDELNRTGAGFNFSKDLVMKAAMVLADLGALEFRASNFNRQNMQRVEAHWAGIDKALRLTARLAASLGFNRDRLSSHTALIPIAYYLLRRGSPESIVTSDTARDDREAIRLWLVRSQLKRTFSGQADSLLRRMRNIIASSHTRFPAEAIYANLRTSVRSMVFDDAQIEGLLDKRFGNQDTFAILALLYPWIQFDQIFHLDHIFPQSRFKKDRLERLGIPQDRWPEWLENKDVLANLQLLPGLVNEEKSDKEFESWLLSREKEPAGLAHYCDMHLIPREHLDFADFPAFLAARRELLRQRLRAILQPESNLPALLQDELAAEYGADDDLDDV